MKFVAALSLSRFIIPVRVMLFKLYVAKKQRPAKFVDIIRLFNVHIFITSTLQNSYVS